jgi:hypothetical protein
MIGLPFNNDGGIMTRQHRENNDEFVNMNKEGPDNKTRQCTVNAELQKEIFRRATSLDLSVRDYLEHIHKTDSVLQIDKGILAIVMAWAPLWLLIIALAFSPQGKDLLVHLSSDFQATALFVAMLIVLCGIATWGASALVAAWLYSRLGFDRPYLFWPKIPEDVRQLSDDEIRDVISAARPPILFTIGIPIAVLATAAVGGKNLLVYLSSANQTALVFAAILVVLCGVGAWRTSALFVTWLRFTWLWIPKEAKSVIDEIVFINWLAVAILITVLVTRAFGPLEWQLEPFVIFFFSASAFFAVIRLVVPLTARTVLHLVSWSYVLLIVGLLGLCVIGSMPAFLSFYIKTEVLIVGVAILWLLVFFGFTFVIYGSRHSQVSRLFSRYPQVSRFIPSFLGQHLNLIIIGLVLVVGAFVKAEIWPEELPLPLMRAADDATPTVHRSLGDALKDFRKLHADEERPPLVLVTAAGGGIRAAYWTAAVLARLQDGQNRFASHIFAISAVSGGALGSSAFKALSTLGTPKPKCPNEQTYAICMDRFLGKDFIGPNIIAVATRGPLGFLSLGLTDEALVPRDKALEDAWSLHWMRIIPEAPRFDGAFDDMFAKRQFPALLLNGTSSISGNRVVTSNLDAATFKTKRSSQQLSGAGTEESSGSCTADGEIVNPAQHLHLSVSSAVLTSARFPYITPPGLLALKGSCRDLEEIVDGGFTDNEGIVTMRDVLRALIDLIGGLDKFSESFRLIVIRLSAEPSPVAASRERTRDRIRGDNWNQLYSTAMAQRAAAGRNLVSDFRDEVALAKGMWVEFNALDDDAPLGWTLSELSRQRLTSWLEDPSSIERAELNPNLSEKERAILRNFAHLTDMPGRIEKVLSQFENPGRATPN